jgi:UDP-glucose 4-epimerase
MTIPDGFFQGRRVLITGGLGFLGSNLAHRLVALGAEVTLVDALFPKYGGNWFNVEGIRDKLTVKVADVREVGLMDELVIGQDAIFHFAAQVSYIDSLDDPLEDLDMHCGSTLVALEACRYHNPDARFIFSSSRLQFGAIDPEHNPVKEDTPNRPLSLYGIHKAASERYLYIYHKDFGLRTVSFRIANPYGPRQQMKHSKYSIVGWFIRQAMDGSTIKIFGDGRQLRDYVYVDDMVEAMLLAVVSDRSAGQVYNLGSGIGTPFGEMARAVVDVVGSGGVEFVPWPDDYERNETGDYVTDISKAREELGFEPRIPLVEGIENTAAYYRQYKEHYWK